MTHATTEGFSVLLDAVAEAMRVAPETDRALCLTVRRDREGVVHACCYEEHRPETVTRRSVSPSG